MIIPSYNNGIYSMFSECLSVESIILYGINMQQVKFNSLVPVALHNFTPFLIKCTCFRKCYWI